jgi:tagatose 1,6-diphosphate aldolase|tara:strand:+ start:860 stop:1891 length:1032 start_codon:yes stop_codon:yes gene_type:complete
MQLSAGKSWSLRRTADKNGLFKMASLDQIPPIVGPMAAFHGASEAPFDDVVTFKRLLIEQFQGYSSAMLLDPQFAVPGCIDALDASKGLFISLEDPSYDLVANNERRSKSAESWSVGKIKRMGGNAVKMLAWYRPDASAETNQHQQNYVMQVGDACAKYDIPFFLELLAYPLDSDSTLKADDVNRKERLRDTVLQSVEEFAKSKYQVDVFMLESPIEGSDAPGVGHQGEEHIQPVFEEMARLANRPWAMLSTGATMAEFNKIMTHAYAAGSCGYLAGRTYWLDTLAHYPDWSAMQADIHQNVSYYIQELNDITDKMATPWSSHSCYSAPLEADRAFCSRYADM